MLTREQQSKAMSFFNKMRADYQRRGADKDVERMNRALGLVMSGEERPYKSTRFECDCPDHKYRGVVCKHMKAEAIKEHAGIEDGADEDIDALNDLLFA